MLMTFVRGTSNQRNVFAGEIGQVGKSTYLHGFTAAVGILREKGDAETR